MKNKTIKKLQKFEKFLEKNKIKKEDIKSERKIYKSEFNTHDTLPAFGDPIHTFSFELDSIKYSIVLKNNNKNSDKQIKAHIKEIKNYIKGLTCNT